MNYHNITTCDMKNGEGLRVVLWVSGCQHMCVGCQNPQTWDRCSGIEFTQETFEELSSELGKDYHDGITLSGGDPLATFNRDKVTEIVKELKKAHPSKTVWCYTGYKFEDVKHLPIMEYIDVLVDGKFIEELKDDSMKWSGSSNQVIYRKSESGEWYDSTNL